jgi:hypothetical protein
MLGPIQRGLEELYRIQTDLDVTEFLIDGEARELLGVTRAPREQLLLSQHEGNLEMGLFVDERVLENLKARDPRQRLDEDNLQDFLLTVEGVSHFVYMAWRARHQRPVTGLELELQAEVDKYVTCLLTMIAQDGRPPADLRARLFERFSLEPGMDPEERERYVVANSNARAYAGRLEGRYVANGNLGEMLVELRRFYRMSAGEKLSLCGV